MLSQELMSTIQALRDTRVESLKATFSQPTSATTGLQFYNLYDKIVELTPFETPWVNETPTTDGQFNIQSNYKAITSLNSSKLTAGIPEGTRNGQFDYGMSEYAESFKTMSMEGSATLQANLAAQGGGVGGAAFDDLNARARRNASLLLLVEEEWTMLGGNSTTTGIALTAPAAPAVTAASTGGAITTAAVFFKVAALSPDGVRQASTTGCGTQRTVTPFGGGSAYTVNLGAGPLSAQATVGSLTGATNLATATWSAVPGAAGYAVYVGSTTGDANLFFHSVVYVNSLVISAIPTAPQQAATALTANWSQNQYVFNGFNTLVTRNDPNTGAQAGYCVSLGGATLTATGKGGVVQFNDWLTRQYIMYQLDDYEIWFGAGQSNNISNKCLSGSTTTPFMVQVDAGAVNLTTGQTVSAITHPITGRKIPLRHHFSMPAGLIFFKLKSVPASYSNNNLPAIFRLARRMSYTSFEFPMTTLRKDVAAVVDETYQGFVPFGSGLLSEVAIG